MRRHALGILGILCLVGGLLAWFSPGDRDEAMLAIAGSASRIGAVLLTVWLAFPQISRVPPWMYKSGLVSALVIAIRPKLAIFVIPAIGLFWVLRPRPAKTKRKS
jgi:hypothetical protein